MSTLQSPSKHSMPERNTEGKFIPADVAHALSARRRIKLARWIAHGVLSGLIALLFISGLVYSTKWYGYPLAAVLVFFLFSDLFIWFASPFVQRFFCPHCHKYIPSSEKWVCGFCNHHNLKTLHYSFLRKCKQCKKAPDAYKCGHCKELILFSANASKKTFASKLLPLVTPETADERKARLNRECEEQQHQIALARLKFDLAKEAARLDELQKKPEPIIVSDELEDDYNATARRHLRIYEIASKKTAEANEKYANDPDMRERVLEVIEAWKADKM